MNKWYRVTILIPEKRMKNTYWPKEIFKADSTLHYLLAAEVFSKYTADVVLWRFSRYHYSFNDIVMKFKFYTQEYIFNRIKEDILKDKIILKLKKEKLIKISIEKATESDERIGSDRDVNWNYEISESWPYFINGLSKMWLNMILLKKEKYLKENYITIDYDIDKMSLGTLIGTYQVIMDLVAEDWISSGSHAVYHHANALFGYRPVRFNVEAFSLYYGRERKVNGSKEAWLKRFKSYDKHIKRLLFMKKIFPWIKFKNRVGYVNL